MSIFIDQHHDLFCLRIMCAVHIMHPYVVCTPTAIVIYRTDVFGMGKLFANTFRRTRSTVIGQNKNSKFAVLTNQR